MHYSNTLPGILAQLVHFAHDDYLPEGRMPPDVGWSIAYVAACFLAQHTKLGDGGVDTEVTHTGLQVGHQMSYTERLALAEELVREWEG